MPIRKNKRNVKNNKRKKKERKQTNNHQMYSITLQSDVDLPEHNLESSLPNGILPKNIKYIRPVPEIAKFIRQNAHAAGASVQTYS